MKNNEDHLIIKKIFNDKRRVNRFIALKEKEAQIKKELEKMKKLFQATYCTYDIGKNDKILIEGSKKDIEIGYLSDQRSVTEKKLCFDLINESNPDLIWDCLTFSVPKVEEVLSLEDFKNVITSILSDNRPIRIKKKQQN